MRRPIFNPREHDTRLRRVNEQIRLSPVRLIDETGTMIGEVPTDEALRRARDAGLDLVEMDPNSRPPVCKILDYGKYKYNESKKKHHKSPEQELKEIRLRPKTDKHDREIKVGHAREFIEKGHKVQFTMMFKGRERAHPGVALEAFREILDALQDIAKTDQDPRTEGRRMTMVVVPLVAVPVGGHKPAAAPKKAPKPASEKPADGATPPAGDTDAAPVAQTEGDVAASAPSASTESNAE